MRCIWSHTELEFVLLFYVAFPPFYFAYLRQSHPVYFRLNSKNPTSLTILNFQMTFIKSFILF